MLRCYHLISCVAFQGKCKKRNLQNKTEQVVWECSGEFCEWSGLQSESFCKILFSSCWFFYVVLSLVV